MSTSNADPCMHELCLAIFRLQLLPLACMNFVFFANALLFANVDPCMHGRCFCMHGLFLGLCMHSLNLKTCFLACMDCFVRGMHF